MAAVPSKSAAAIASGTVLLIMVFLLKAQPANRYRYQGPALVRERPGRTEVPLQKRGLRRNRRAKTSRPSASPTLPGQTRLRLSVHADRTVNLQADLRAWLDPVKLPSSVFLTIDVDPQSFL
jgi:hypothetical protein